MFLGSQEKGNLVGSPGIFDMLLLGDLLSRWCRCKEPARRLHMQWVGKSNMYMSIDYYEDEEDDDDTNNDLVSETEPFAD